MVNYKLLRILSFFIFPVGVFFFSSFIGAAFDLFNVYTWLDIPFHFLGGLAIAHTSVLFLSFFKEEKAIEIRNRFLFSLFVVSLVALIAVLWEFYEFFMKMFFGLNMQPTVADTLLDFFMGLLGGAFGALAFRKL